MRPSRRFLILATAALVLTVLVLAIPGLPAEATAVLWLALIAAALIDLTLTRGSADLGVEIAVPQEIFAGEEEHLPVRVIGRRPLARIEAARADLPVELGGVLPLTLTVDGAEARGALRLPARRRGLWPINALWLRWASPFGLWDVIPRLATDATVRIVPNIRAVQSGLIDTAVRSELYGVKDTAMRGEGSEFHQLVEFTTGMDTRSIDWKHSARTRALVAKEMRAERNHQIILCLDNGYLMRGEIDGLARIDHAINGALVVAWAAGLGGDLVGLYSFDAEPRTYTPPQPARAAFPALRSQMAAMGYSSVESNPTLALAHLGGQLKRRSLIVVFSDFADTTTAELLVENLDVLNRQHVIVFVTFRDPDLAGRQDGRARTAGAVAEAVVAADMSRERQVILDRLTRLGIVCLETAPADLNARLLATYLDIKARELI